MKNMNWQHRVMIAMLGMGLAFTSLQSMGCSGVNVDGGGDNGDCEVGGCSSQLCVEPGNDGASTCEWREEYACYQQHGICERGANNQCGWRATQDLQACVEAANNPATRTPVSDQCIRNANDACTTDADCKAGGCGGELCHGINNDGVSDCNCTAPQGISCGCVNGTCSWWQ